MTEHPKILKLREKQRKELMELIQSPDRKAGDVKKLAKKHVEQFKRLASQIAKKQAE